MENKASKPLKLSLLIFSLLFGFIACTQTTNQVENKQQPKPQQQPPESTIIPIDITPTDLTLAEIPASIKIKGDLLEAKSWTDQNGENILVVSRRGPLEEPESKFPEIEQYAELFGEQYLKQGEEMTLLWDIYDFERNCPFDLWIGLLPNSTQVTDWDEDGITETTLIYKLGCRSDVSPSRMKLLIHENDTKMGLRGIMVLEPESNMIDATFEPNFSQLDTVGFSEFERYRGILGRYENEADFQDQPPVFLKHARSLWKEFMIEKDFSQF